MKSPMMGVRSPSLRIVSDRVRALLYSASNPDPVSCSAQTSEWLAVFAQSEGAQPTPTVTPLFSYLSQLSSRLRLF
jgi:hypothetical protein